MTKKSKIVLAVTVLSVAVAVSVTAGAVACRKIYQKKYFSVN